MHSLLMYFWALMLMVCVVELSQWMCCYKSGFILGLPFGNHVKSCLYVNLWILYFKNQMLLISSGELGFNGVFNTSINFVFLNTKFWFLLIWCRSTCSAMVGKIQFLWFYFIFRKGICQWWLSCVLILRSLCGPTFLLFFISSAMMMMMISHSKLNIIRLVSMFF